MKNQPNIFNSLVNNAFDFLERAITEFDTSPKYSVIHFCAAVEMLLKARLMKEHWSLIVSKPELANRKEFIEGDFISVTLNEIKLRLRDIVGENIPDDAFCSFQALAKHRNKTVHFYHADLDSGGQKLEQIVAEHCRAWFHLHRLLDRWSLYFEEFNSYINLADQLMKEHRTYLSNKFKALKKELDECRKSGNKPKVCSACGFKAAIPKYLASQVSQIKCLVCDFTEMQVEMECPHCNHEIAIVGEGYAQCPDCGGEINPEDIAKSFCDQGKARPGLDDDLEWRKINCGYCDEYHTVICLDDGYFCVACFEVADKVEDCEWCNEPNTGNMEDSYIKGCGICSGKGGWDDED